MSDEKALVYIDENSEMMGSPCKWLERNQETTEATCKAHDRKSDHCINYPEHIAGSEWCNVGVAYWSDRKQQQLPIPAWVDKVLVSLSK